MGAPGFDARFFEFYNDLSQNNEREWFQEHKSDYEALVVAPMLRFIEAMGPRLAKISEQILAVPKRSGGSMFRIYRDTRFSKDKTPYKTHAAVQFRHRNGKDAHAPGFYFHVSPREFILGMGLWRPAAPVLEKIRRSIDEHGAAWKEARNHAPFRNFFHWAGESLSRPPKGFPADHPLIGDLKRKDFIGLCELKPPDLLRSDLVDLVAERYQTCQPPMRFLCKAVGVPF